MAAEFFKPYIQQLDKSHYLDIEWTPDPEQTFLLGSRWADFGLCAVFALLIPLTRTILRSLVFQPLGIRVIYGDVKKNDAVVDPEKIRKWNESAWKMVVYICFSVCAFLVSYKEPWFYDTRYLWRGCTSFPPCNMLVSKGVLLFYCMETGFYAQAIHFLAFIEVRRKDWLESMIHHLVTVFLLVYSYHVNFARVGVMILLVHDINDIFLEMAKLCRYGRLETAGTVSFIIFAVSWVLSRCVYFPLVLVKSTLIETLVYSEYQNVHNVEPTYTIFNGLLLVLLALHIYWTYLIWRIIVRQVSGKGLKDIREKDGDDDSDDD